MFTSLIQNSCPCGRCVHQTTSGNSRLYTISMSEKSFILVGEEATLQHIFLYVGQKNFPYAGSFIQRQGELFPEHTCPYVFVYQSNFSSAVSSDFEEYKKTVEDLVVAFGNVLSTDVPIRVDESKFVFNCEDARISDSVVTKKGICPCGFKHKVNGVLCDFAFVVNDVLVGMSVDSNFVVSIRNASDRAHLELAYLPRFFLGAFKAFVNLSAVNNVNKNYFHGQSRPEGYENLNRRNPFMEKIYALAIKPIEEQYIDFLKCWSSLTLKHKGAASTFLRLFGLIDDEDGEEEDDDTDIKCNVNTLYDAEKENLMKRLKEEIVWECAKDVEVVETEKTESVTTQTVDERSEDFSPKKIEKVEKIEPKEAPKADVIPATPEIETITQKKSEEVREKDSPVTNNPQQPNVCFEGEGSPKLENPKSRENVRSNQTNRDYDWRNGNTEGWKKSKGKDEIYGKKEEEELEFLTKEMTDEQKAQFKMMYMLMKLKKSQNEENEEDKTNTWGKGHTLKSEKGEVEDKPDEIEPKEYIYAKDSKKVVKIRYKYGNIVFKGDVTTTVHDLIAHIKFEITKSGKPMYCGKLKQRAYNQPLNEMADKTLEELKLFQTMVTYE
ncbi:hypothetical protein EIN_096330 [Entamoeba invadens IP1]|uniref:Uncharacterized protein n=1 Tax=Entamoeba invadens IP1 TaxID=370355 RepID=A0A0A1U6D6_ENTIV|nr:hypothetical protein EIN_096330 [Entamoeba invadens IP1]ELP87376.1 hypothetical protein EIN_096330 [Entamoeba invadens IP1]|eukprot:XP_004254147.1 hypothetical protein EIN_096330 [Entamoeba invadens IP1]